MASNLLGRNLWLTDAQVRSHAAARSEIPQGLAGRARILWELATGNVPSDGPPASGYNPQGLVGVDCSGPPWGSAHRYTIATLGGIKPDSATFSSRPSTLWRLSEVTTNRLHTIAWRIWHRPFEVLHDPAVAPLSRAYLRVGCYSSSATNPVLTISAWANEETFSEAMSDTVTTTGGTTDTDYDVGTALWVRLRPGPNTVRLAFETDKSTTKLTISRLHLYQTAKRSH